MPEMIRHIVPSASTCFHRSHDLVMVSDSAEVNLVHVRRQYGQRFILALLRIIGRVDWLVIIVGIVAVGQVSCSPAVGNLQIVSRADARVRINPAFQTVVFKPADENGVVIVLSDLPRAQLMNGNLEQGQILVIHMFLRPRAGSTPIEQTATNATFRHVILAKNEIVGIYGGGGFLYPSTKPGSDPFAGSIFEATLQLIESTPDFSDRLETVEISGSVSAPRNDAAVSAIATNLNTEVSRRLGRVYFVMQD